MVLSDFYALFLLAMKWLLHGLCILALLRDGPNTYLHINPKCTWLPC